MTHEERQGCGGLHREGDAGRQRRCAILENTPIARGVYRLRLAGGTAGFEAGQFANVMVPGYFLRRPIALSDWDADSFTLIYKLAGAGTRALSTLPAGTELEVLVPLGHGFGVDGAKSSRCEGEPTASKALLIGGGCGVGPLYALAKALKAAGQPAAVALGFASAADAYLHQELAAVADGLWIATVDGSLGQTGMVTAVLDEAAEGCGRFYACGPTAMLKAVCAALPLPGQVSLEERMACGFGGCMGCAIETRDGMRRVCADGPVFDREVLEW